MNKLILSALLLLGSTTTFAQPHSLPKCGYDLAIKNYQKVYPDFKSWQDRTYILSQDVNVGAKTTNTLYRVPVVFHIVYNNANQNLPDSLIYSQLEILNQAFRKQHSDTGNTRTQFKPLSQDAQIEFYLATKDPQGNGSTGITRTQTNITSFGDLISLFMGSFDSLERVKYTNQGGQDAWPTDQYLNIWINDMSDADFANTPFLLGYASPPTNPIPSNWPIGSIPPIKDGVVLQYQTIGKHNPFKADLMDMAGVGRTAVHEVGHYFGLRHIGGDDENCDSSSDGIPDTPVMNQSDQNDLTCSDFTKNTCGSGATDTVDMWENYMDYSNDACQNMFTTGQINHMRSVLLSSRSVLSAPAIAKENKFTIYPNPASNNLYFDYPHAINAITIYNILGQEVKRLSASVIKNRVVDLQNLQAGNYILKVTAGNGTHATQRFTITR